MTAQLENGYLKIANKIVDALAKTSIGLGNSQVLWVILRKTYGWNKKSDDISISQIQEATNMSRRNVIYCLQNLEAKKVIEIKRSKSKASLNNINHITFNKKCNEWVVQEKAHQYYKALQQKKLHYKKSLEGVVQEKRGSARIGNKVVQELVIDVPFLAPTKDTTTKDTIQKTNDYPHFKITEFTAIYENFKDHRKLLKAPMTKKAEKLLLNKLHRVDVKDAVLMLEKSIESGWRSVFPLKEGDQDGRKYIKC